MAKKYNFIGGEKPFQCTECGRTFTSEGGFNLHGPCGPGYRKGNNQKKGKKKAPEPEPDPDPAPECNHNMRTLNLANETEKTAYDAGYKEVCDKCLDLR